jgi:hypothetical protein
MKTRFLLFAGLLLTLSACKKDNPEPENTDPFLGKWEIVDAEGAFAEDNKGSVYDFKADGTLKITKGFSTNGTYTRTDTEISYEIGGIELNFSYTLSGDSMSWQNLSSSDQKFEFEKR